MTLYDTISVRRSVRKFDEVPIDDSTLNDIQEFIAGVKQIGGQTARFEVVSSDAVKGPAPHYVLAYCEESDAAYVNVGYVLQMIDLYIQSIGLGSLYLGLKKPIVRSKDFCIMLAFGRSDVPFRGSEQDFKRLPIDEISSFDDIVSRAARLAPSARNSQPWKLTSCDNNIRIEYIGRGAFKSILRNRLSMIDIGIVTCHVELGLFHERNTVNKMTLEPDGKGFSVTLSFE